MEATFTHVPSQLGQDIYTLSERAHTTATRPESTGTTPHSEAPLQLTDRQREVLQLVAEGKTDRQIAAQLVLSEKTVGRHMENIFTRLGVRSRAAASVVALRRGLA